HWYPPVRLAASLRRARGSARLRLAAKRTWHHLLLPRQVFHDGFQGVRELVARHVIHQIAGVPGLGPRFTVDVDVGGIHHLAVHARAAALQADGADLVHAAAGWAA